MVATTLDDSRGIIHSLPMNFEHVSDKFAVSLAPVCGNGGEEGLLVRPVGLVSIPERFPNIAAVVCPSCVRIAHQHRHPGAGNHIDVAVHHFAGLSGGNYRVVEDIRAVLVVQKPDQLWCVCISRLSRARRHGLPQSAGLPQQDKESLFCSLSEPSQLSPLFSKWTKSYQEHCSQKDSLQLDLPLCGTHHAETVRIREPFLQRTFPIWLQLGTFPGFGYWRF